MSLIKEDVHFTNVAVQKIVCDYDPGKGCKWGKHGAGLVEVLFVDTDNIFIHSLQSVQKVISDDKHCFELYSYDILIHQDLKPLNHVKCKQYHRLRGKKHVGGFDLIRNDGSVSRGEDLGTLVNENTMTSTCLGCYDERKKQLKQLFRNLPAQQKV